MLFKPCRESSILGGEEAFGMVPPGESLKPNTEHLRAPMEEVKIERIRWMEEAGYNTRISISTQISRISI